MARAEPGHFIFLDALRLWRNVRAKRGQSPHPLKDKNVYSFFGGRSERSEDNPFIIPRNKKWRGRSPDILFSLTPHPRMSERSEDNPLLIPSQNGEGGARHFIFLDAPPQDVRAKRGEIDSMNYHIILYLRVNIPLI